MGIKDQSEDFCNRNLVALVAVIFLFYGGLSCLYSTLIPHLVTLSLTLHEISCILTIVALVSIIGPLFFGPLVDRIADRRRSQYGTILQAIIAVLLILGAIAYGLLLLVPSVTKTPAEDPLVSFGCNESGAFIYQKRCQDEKTCHHWDDAKLGSLVIANCSYTCQNPEKYENLYQTWLEPSLEPQAAPIIDASRERPDEDDYSDRRLDTMTLFFQSIFHCYFSFSLCWGRKLVLEHFIIFFSLDFFFFWQR